MCPVLRLAIDNPSYAQPKRPGVFVVPKGAEEKYIEACDLAEKGENAKAFAIAISIKSDYPNFIPIYFDLAVLTLDMKRYEEATKFIETFLIHRPKDADSWALLGLAFSGLKQDKKAIEAYTNSINFNPKYSTTTYYNRGLALLRSDQPDKAINDFKFILKVEPNYKDGRTMLGYSFLRAKQFDNGIIELNKAIESDRNDALAWGFRGVCLFAQGEDEKARRDLAHCLKLDESLKKRILDELFLAAKPGRSILLP
jgi:tetratricopeptide (TPR) repeat protein